MAQVRQLVTERADQARVLERPPRGCVSQPNPDDGVRGAEAVVAVHPRALGFERAVAQVELAGDALGVTSQPRHQRPGLSTLHR